MKHMWTSRATDRTISHSNRLRSWERAERCSWDLREALTACSRRMRSRSVAARARIRHPNLASRTGDSFVCPRLVMLVPNSTHACLEGREHQHRDTCPSLTIATVLFHMKHRLSGSCGRMKSAATLAHSEKAYSAQTWCAIAPRFAWTGAFHVKRSSGTSRPPSHS